MNLVDPEGTDIWCLDASGQLTRIPDISKDEFVCGDNIITFAFGTIEDEHLVTYNGKKVYDLLKVRGDDQGTQLFEFLAQNSNVEWSHAMLGMEGSQGLNYITTSNMPDQEYGMSNLIKWQLRHGYTARRFDHSHPNNDCEPSGGDGDTSFANVVKRIFENNNILFHIFTPATKQYHMYDETYVSSIPECIIKAY